MLQFDKSETTNTNAVWVQTVNTASGYYNTLKLVYSQSYDESNGDFDLLTVSSPNRYRNWLVISNSGSAVPSASGQYDIKIYNVSEVEASTWNSTDDVWSTTTQTWDDFGDSGSLADLIYSDRAYISGSNESTITQYLSPNENGTYTTYNG